MDYQCGSPVTLNNQIINFCTGKEVRKLTQHKGCTSLGTSHAMQQHLPALLRMDIASAKPPCYWVALWQNTYIHFLICSLQKHYNFLKNKTRELVFDLLVSYQHLWLYVAMVQTYEGVYAGLAVPYQSLLQLYYCTTIFTSISPSSTMPTLGGRYT